jgi:hypothetical protein
MGLDEMPQFAGQGKALAFTKLIRWMFYGVAIRG